jgi:hypothetical protein
VNAFYFIISAISLLGVCLLPFIKKKIYEKLLIVLTGLGRFLEVITILIKLFSIIG